MLDLGAHGVALVGDVPSGLPTPELPPLELIREHIAVIVIAGVALVLIGFSQTAGDARAFAARHRYRIDVNQESVAQGMAQRRRRRPSGHARARRAFRRARSTSPPARARRSPRSSRAASSCSRCWSSRPLFSDLPKAVLGAVIIDAVVFGMIDVAELRRLRRVARVDFWIAIAAIIGVLLAGVLVGVVIGVVLSLGWLIYVTTTPPMPVLGRQPGTQVFRDLGTHPGDEVFAGVMVLRLDSGLFFATADALDERVREVANGASLRGVVLDLEGVNFIDSQGAEKLVEIQEYVASIGATLRLARVKPRVHDLLEADGVIERIGADHVHGNVHRAVEAQLQEGAAAPTGIGSAET